MIPIQPWWVIALCVCILGGSIIVAATIHWAVSEFKLAALQRRIHQHHIALRGPQSPCQPAERPQRGARSRVPPR